MRRRRRRIFGLSVAAVLALLVPAGMVAGADRAVQADTPTVEQPGSQEERDRLERDLQRLADAWALGGGTFGFPFWEKAGQRWRTDQVGTPLYREYVTGYRDRLRGGCELLDAVDVDQRVADDVKGLVVDSCRSRLRALRAQQQWLDVLMELDQAAVASASAPVTGDDAPDAAERAQELQVEAADHEREYRELLQASYRDARLAMQLAQSALDGAGRERLAEDAFI